MKAFACVAFAALLFGWALAVDCPGAADPSCAAFASLEILTTAGNCKGEAGADCEAVSSSQSKFKEAFKGFFAGDPKAACDGARVEAAATAVATAIAEVWANAASKVECDGRGFACGWSISGGNTFALGMAEALAQAAGEAIDGENAAAFCYADVRAVSTALAEAAATAQSDVCVTNTGKQEDFQASYVKAVKKAIADALASATARACDKGDEVIAKSECKGEASATTDESIVKAGDACGGTSQLQACSGSGATMCCDPDFKQNWCRCENCNGPWVKKSETNDLKKVFEDKEGKKCFCLDTKDGGTPPVDDPPIKDPPVDDPPVKNPPIKDPPVDDPPIDDPPVKDPPVKDPPVKDNPPVEDPPVEDPPATVECPGAADTSCSAFATLEILVTGGTCSGKATASCEAVNESQSQFKSAYEEWWSEDGSSCDKGKAETAAEAVAVAIASVWAEAAVQVTCDGRGFACGWSASGGNTWAVAFAEALAQAAAEASDPHGQANAFCFSDVRAVSTVIADAAAAAQADACTTKGTKEDFQSSFAETIQIGIATAFASATASACTKEGSVAAESLCVGDASSVTEGETTVVGNACGGVKQLEACPGVGASCCKRSFKRALCNCSKHGCKNGPWIRIDDYNDEKNTKRTFEDRKKNQCFCLE